MFLKSIDFKRFYGGNVKNGKNIYFVVQLGAQGCTPPPRTRKIKLIVNMINI